MMDLKALNPQQRQAVAAPDGPVLVLAGPGSGKTRVLTHRVAWLVLEKDIAPWRIMAVTFTNKAAREMRDRLVKMLGAEQAHRLTLGTFHATCARILRRDGEAIGIPRDYAIFDADDQVALVRKVLKELNIDEKRYSPASVHAAISRAKNDLITADAYQSRSYFGEIVRRVYARYQEQLRASHALDFDDLLIETVRLFREHADILASYQERYLHILVDEFQDTNMVQYLLLRQLAGRHRNLFVVADEDQCVPGDTLVSTANGSQAIESLLPGDRLRVAAGRGETMETLTWRRRAREYDGQVVTVRTRGGRQLTTTPNHIMFARLGEPENRFYVYLMYRRDMGYRLGIVRSSRCDGCRGELQNGLVVRGNQEKADKIWILKVCGSRAEAFFWEQFYAFQYGVPTTVFFTKGRDMALSQQYIDELYRRVDTEARAEKLMEDLFISPHYPHHRPKGIAGNRQPARITVQLRMFGDNRRTSASPWNAHRVSINTSDLALREHMIERGYNPRPARRGSWKLDWSNLDYGEALRLAQEVALTGGGLEIAYSAFLSDTQSKGGIMRRYDLHPASHLRPTMLVPVEVDGRIVDDEIVSVEWQPFSGTVYDLDVDRIHNYIADGIVVHNSIYAWRGADYRNIARLREDHPGLVTYLLEQNYRSNQTILDVAQAIIRHNPGRTEKKLFTKRGKGPKVFVHEAYDQEEEAEFVVQTIAALTRAREAEPGHFAVMYRTNAQSRALEDAFIRAGQPYRLVGATRFYARREIKDLLAFLRLIHNPADSTSLLRIINVPNRGIGQKTIQVLEDAAVARGEPLWWAVEALATGQSGAPDPGSRARAAVSAFYRLVRGWIDLRDELMPADLLSRVIADTEYEPYLRDGTEEGDDRWANVQELETVAAGYDGLTLTDFLADVALVSDVDNLAEETSAPTLLTLHSAKGLEFPIVFIVGLEDGLLPHSRSLDDPEQLAEERRLMYVGITRARDRLYLTRASRRAHYGSYESTCPSRFLDEIPANLIEGAPGRSSSGGRTWTVSWQPTPAARFGKGDRVRHDAFGEGIVVESQVRGGEEEVTVVFKRGAIKRILASFLKKA